MPNTQMNSSTAQRRTTMTPDKLALLLYMAGSLCFLFGSLCLWFK
jgi:hypothetical protein